MYKSVIFAFKLRAPTRELLVAICFAGTIHKIKQMKKKNLWLLAPPTNDLMQNYSKAPLRPRNTLWVSWFPAVDFQMDCWKHCKFLKFPNSSELPASLSSQPLNLCSSTHHCRYDLFHHQPVTLPVLMQRALLYGYCEQIDPTHLELASASKLASRKV